MPTDGGFSLGALLIALEAVRGISPLWAIAACYHLFMTCAHTVAMKGLFANPYVAVTTARIGFLYSKIGVHHE